MEASINERLQNVPSEHRVDVRRALVALGERASSESLCQVVDPEIFDESNRSTVDLAKAYCGACAVQASCLEYAIVKGEKTLIWGGMTPEERRTAKRRSKRYA